MDGNERSASMCPRRVLPFALILAAGVYLAAPHLQDEIWYDETYTLEYSATGNVADAFTKYHTPNNHVLFSAALSLWRGVNGSAPWLRLLPFAAFLLSVGLLMLAAARLGGRLAALFAGALFATSHVTINFAAQLRGYGPSWVPVAAGLLLVLLFMQTGRTVWGLLYVLAAAVGVSILPTNLTAFAILGVWAAAMTLASGRWRSASSLIRLALILVAPLGAAISYAWIWDKVAKQSARAFGSQTLAGVFRHWSWATLVDFWWLAPIAALGLAVLVRAAWKDRSSDVRSPRSQLLLLASCLVVAPLAYALVEHVPVPRTLVPLLPLWYAALAVPLAAGCRRLGAETSVAGRVGVAALLLAVLVVGVVRESDNAGYGSRNPDGSRPQNVYDQYYHHAFTPAGMTEVLHRLAGATPTSIIMTDDSDLWALRYAIRSAHPDDLGAPCVYYKWPEFENAGPDLLREGNVLIVACSPGRAANVAKYLGIPDENRPTEVGSTGFFKVYLCPQTEPPK